MCMKLCRVHDLWELKLYVNKKPHKAYHPCFPALLRAGDPNSISCIVEIQEIKNALNVLNSFQEHVDIKEITDSTDTAIEF